MSARGRVIEMAPPAPVWSARASSAAISWSVPPSVERRTPATWDGTPFDLGYVIDVLRGSEPVPLGGPA